MKKIEIVVGGFYVQKKNPDNIRYVCIINDWGDASYFIFDAKNGKYFNDGACHVGTLASLSDRRLTDDEASKINLKDGVKAFIDQKRKSWEAAADSTNAPEWIKKLFDRLG